MYTGDKTAEYHISQHILATNRSMQKTADTTNVTGEASTISKSTPSESQYNKLQFTYNDNNQHNNSFYAKLSPKYLSPTYECLAIQHHTAVLNENTSSAKNGINTKEVIHTKTAVATSSEPTVLNQNGTEIVSLGRFQTDMLSTRVDHNYKITPSTVYKSYVEVINCS